MSLIDWVEAPGRAVALISFVVVIAGTGCKGEAAASASIDPSVTVATARRGGAGRTVRLSGTIEADRTLVLGFAQPGTVEAVLVREGEPVKRGQILARLVTRALVDSLGIAKAKAAQAEDAYKRLEPLHESQTVPDIKWVEVETGRQQAQLMVSIAQKNLDDATLRAPEDGVVSRRQVEAGASVMPGVPAITLVSAGRVQAVAPMPETRIGSVRNGQPARVTVSAMGRTFQGAVREIGVLADPLTRTYPIKVAIQDADASLRVGMVADVYVEEGGDGDAGDALAVPPSAVRIDERGDTYVYVVSGDGRARRAPVHVTGFVGEDTAVTGAIEDGAHVVTSGTPMLDDGVAVRVINAGAVDGGSSR